MWCGIYSCLIWKTSLTEIYNIFLINSYFIYVYVKNLKQRETRKTIAKGKF